jgi:hypothetical protein
VLGLASRGEAAGPDTEATYKFSFFFLFFLFFFFFFSVLLASRIEWKKGCLSVLLTCGENSSTEKSRPKTSHFVLLRISSSNDDSFCTPNEYTMQGLVFEEVS